MKTSRKKESLLDGACKFDLSSGSKSAVQWTLQKSPGLVLSLDHELSRNLSQISGFCWDGNFFRPTNTCKEIWNTLRDVISVRLLEGTYDPFNQELFSSLKIDSSTKKVLFFARWKFNKSYTSTWLIASTKSSELFLQFLVAEINLL